jgi:hypothetical protein
MKKALAEYHKVFRIFPSENQLGIVVAPFVPDNYGPKYLVRIDRMKLWKERKRFVFRCRSLSRFILISFILAFLLIRGEKAPFLPY